MNKLSSPVNLPLVTHPKTPSYQESNTVNRQCPGWCRDAGDL